MEKLVIDDKLAMVELYKMLYTDADKNKLATKQELRKYLEMYTKSELLDIMEDFSSIPQGRKYWMQSLKSTIIDTVSSIVEYHAIGW